MLQPLLALSVRQPLALVVPREHRPLRQLLVPLEHRFNPGEDFKHRRQGREGTSGHGEAPFAKPEEEDYSSWVAEVSDGVRDNRRSGIPKDLMHNEALKLMEDMTRADEVIT